MKAVLSANAPVCYFTMNHGESMSDYSLMFAATDAGYMVNYLDSLSFDIPADCDLLISYNPVQDFAARDSVTGISEIEKLDAYLSRGGKMMVFVSADTFAAGSFGNLEGFLADWGVTFDHAKGASGVEGVLQHPRHRPLAQHRRLHHPRQGCRHRQSRRDDAAGHRHRPACQRDRHLARRRLERCRQSVVERERTAYALLRSYPGAEAWAGGRAVARTDEGFNLDHADAGGRERLRRLAAGLLLRGVCQGGCHAVRRVRQRDSAAGGCGGNGQDRYPPCIWHPSPSRTGASTS